MNDEDMHICNEATERFGVVSHSYLMRKLKCDYHQADKLIKDFIIYTLEKDPVNYRRLCEIIYENISS